MTDAQKRANAKYKARNRENITLEAPKGYNDKIKQLSILAGKSKARYIMDAIAAQAQRDGHADIYWPLGVIATETERRRRRRTAARRKIENKIIHYSAENMRR